MNVRKGENNADSREERKREDSLDEDFLKDPFIRE